MIFTYSVLFLVHVLMYSCLEEHQWTVIQAIFCHWFCSYGNMNLLYTCACIPLYRVWAGYPKICVFYCCHFGPLVGWGSCSLQQLLCAAGGTLWTSSVHHGETIATVTEWKRKELSSSLAFRLHDIIMWPKNWGEASLVPRPSEGGSGDETREEPAWEQG